MPALGTPRAATNAPQGILTRKRWVPEVCVVLCSNCGRYLATVLEDAPRREFRCATCGEFVRWDGEHHAER